jgi:hypothetical protein
MINYLSGVVIRIRKLLDLPISQHSVSQASGMAIGSLIMFLAGSAILPYIEKQTSFSILYKLLYICIILVSWISAPLVFLLSLLLLVVEIVLVFATIIRSLFRYVSPHASLWVKAPPILHGLAPLRGWAISVRASVNSSYIFVRGFFRTIARFLYVSGAIIATSLIISVTIQASKYGIDSLQYFFAEKSTRDLYGTDPIVGFLLDFPFWTLILLTFAVMMYAIRTKRRFTYAIIEITVGIIAIQAAIISVRGISMAKVAGSAGGVYVIIRGLDNINTALDDSRASPETSKTRRTLNFLVTFFGKDL